MASIAAWLIAFVAYVAYLGVPTSRADVVLWAVLAVVALGMGAPHRLVRTLVRDWAPIAVALVGYDLLRGSTDGSPADAHTWPQLDLDAWLGGGQALSVRLQDAWYVAGDVRWYDLGAWGVYVSHFFVPLAIAVGLGACRSPRFRPFLYGIAVLSWLSLLTYWLYPAQPPWMTGGTGGHEPVARVMQGAWSEVGLDRASRIWAPGDPAGGNYANQVAAIPSLHAAFPFLALLLLRGIRRWVDVLLVVYVAAMAVTLVYSGEHFTFDIVLGWAYAAIAAWVVIRVAASVRAGRLAQAVAPLPHRGVVASR